MSDREFTAKEVNKLVFAIIVVISFLETSVPGIFSWAFLREFILNLIVHGGVALVVFLFLGTLSND